MHCFTLNELINFCTSFTMPSIFFGITPACFQNSKTALAVSRTATGHFFPSFLLWNQKWRKTSFDVGNLAPIKRSSGKSPRNGILEDSRDCIFQMSKYRRYKYSLQSFCNLTHYLMKKQLNVFMDDRFLFYLALTMRLLFLMYIIKAGYLAIWQNIFMLYAVYCMLDIM